LEKLIDSHGETIRPLGVTFIDSELTLYWASPAGSIISVVVEIPRQTILEIPKERQILKRHAKNPIIEPHSKNEWEDEAVFNPAAIYDDGRVHLLYRAMGHKRNFCNRLCFKPRWTAL
jgi:hypothetical protein